MATDTLVLEAEGTDIDSLIATLESLPVGQERELRLYMPQTLSETELAALRDGFTSQGFQVLSVTQEMDIVSVLLKKASQGVAGVSGIGWLWLLALPFAAFFGWQIFKTTQEVHGIFSSIPSIVWIIGAGALAYWLVSRERRMSRQTGG